MGTEKNRSATVLMVILTPILYQYFKQLKLVYSAYLKNDVKLVMGDANPKAKYWTI
jgi:hypothetical protein